MLVQEMLVQDQAKLEETQVTPIGSMNGLDPAMLLGYHTQIDDPDVGQALPSRLTAVHGQEQLKMGGHPGSGGQFTGERLHSMRYVQHPDGFQGWSVQEAWEWVKCAI